MNHALAYGLRALVTVCALAPHALGRQTPPAVGAGLNGVSDWSRTNEFADLIHQARRFGSPLAPWDEAAPVDERGWPTGDAGVVLMCAQVPGPALAGVYRIRFECAATPSIGRPATAGLVRDVRRDDATGVVTAEFVMPADATQIMLNFQGTHGGIRNLSVMRPGARDGDLFTAPFLDHNRRFEILRGMDWNLTNGNETVRWDQRTRPEDATWRWRTGVPYEVLADLCNSLGRDLWINVPAKADDDFVRNLARLLRDRLDSDRKVYVEYSNEVWNWSFSQAVWNWQQAVDEALAGGSDLAFDGATDHNILRWRRYARESVRVGRLFTEEFGPGSFAHRVRPVLCAQVSWSDQYRVALEYIRAIHGEPASLIYALGGAPYFAVGPADSRTDLTPDEVLSALSASIDATNASIAYERLAAHTAWWGLAPFMAYEGGPDTFGPNNIAAKRAASHDPRMQELCRRYLRGWTAAGGGPFAWFVSGAREWNSPYGTWTLTEDMAVQDTPKILALDDFTSLPPAPLSAGAHIPGSFEARRFLDRRSTWLDNPTTGIVAAGFKFDYLLRADTPGRYRLRVEAAAWSPDAALGVTLDRAPAADLPLPTTGPRRNTDYAWSHPLAVDLPAGLSVLRLTTRVAYTLDLRSVALSCNADFNADGFLDFFDYDDFVQCFEWGRCPPSTDADFNADGFTDIFDYDLFVSTYEAGC